MWGFWNIWELKFHSHGNPGTYPREARSPFLMAGAPGSESEKREMMSPTFRGALSVSIDRSPEFF